MHLQALQRPKIQRAAEVRSRSQAAAVVADNRPDGLAMHQRSEALNGSGQVVSQRKLATALNAGSPMLAPLQMVRNPAPRSWWGGLRERMSAGADTTSVLTGALTGSAVTAIAAANAWNPLGWGLAAGIGAGVLGTGLMSYLRGPENLQRDSDRRMGLEGYDENADGDWTPQDVARRHIDRAQRGETDYPLETRSHEWDGGSYRIDSGSGMMRYHKGRGGQMYIRTRADDFGGQKIGDDYDSLVSTLSHDDPEVEEERANILLRLSRGEDVDLDGIPNKIRRAMTFLLGMTQVAEENPSRSSGSAGTARASFRSIADGTSTFHQEFNRTNGRYVPAHVGGTGEMREVVSGTRMLHDDLAGNMSDDEI